MPEPAAKSARTPRQTQSTEPELTPPPGPPPDLPRRRHAGARLYGGLFIGLLAVIALGVVVLLPAQLDKTTAQSRAATGPGEARGPADALLDTADVQAGTTRIPDTPELTSPEPGAPESKAPGTTVPAQASASLPAKSAAEAALRQALMRQAQLENAGVAVWGVERLRTSYAAARAALNAADEHFEAGRFAVASEHYREAVRYFDTLDESRPARLQTALAQGRDALAAEDPATAEHAYAIALALAPGHAEALAGLQRAQRRPQAVAELERGRALEVQGKLQTALQAYQAALVIEAQFTAAQGAAEQLNERIRARDFSAAMGEATAAFDAARLDAARRALARARTLKPRSPQVAELAQGLAAATKARSLQALRERASELARTEHWAEALDTYEAALRLDDAASFALRGRARAQNFVEVHRQFELYLSKPERLHSPAPLARAQTVLAATEGIADAGPRLQRERAQLAALIALAQQPVDVLLRSDGETEITILRVQRLGTFDEHLLTLRPGVYTALGTRSGYRDVRVRVEVSPSMPRLSVDIRCEEAI